jgi:hypothetical protein
VARGALRIWKYWDFVLEPFEDIPPDAEAQWCEELRALLGRAVKRRLISDCPDRFVSERGNRFVRRLGIRGARAWPGAP